MKRKKFYCWCFVCASILVLSSCGNKEKTKESKSEITTETVKKVEKSKQENSSFDKKYSNQDIRKMENFLAINQLVDNFLKEYYTYEKFGSNFDSYKEYLLPSVRDQRKKDLEQQVKANNMAGFMRSEFISADLYVNQPEYSGSDVICRVSNYFDELDAEGNFIGTAENKQDVVVTVTQHEGQYYVKGIRGIQITE